MGGTDGDESAEKTNVFDEPVRSEGTPSLDGMAGENSTTTSKTVGDGEISTDLSNAVNAIDEVFKDSVLEKSRTTEADTLHGYTDDTLESTTPDSFGVCRTGDKNSPGSD